MRFGRLWKTWLIFGFCLVLVLIAMGWISRLALELEKNEIRTRNQAQQEENVRLALWRMDSLLAPVVGEENSRPYIHYEPFYAAQSAYTKMFASVKQGDIIIPSPLLAGKSVYAVIHFQFDPDGSLNSPQVPAGNMKDLAESRYIQPEAIDEGEERLERLRRVVDRDKIFELLKKKGEIILAQNVVENRADTQNTFQADAIAFRQLERNAAEFEARSRVQNALPRNSAPALTYSMSDFETQAGGSASRSKKLEKALSVQDPGEKYRTDKSMMSPLWINGELFLVRCFDIDQKIYIQGCWLDWEKIRSALLMQVKDLLPEARLEKFTGEGEKSMSSRILASLPIRIIPGRISEEVISRFSTVKVSLLISWLFVLLGSGTVAVFVVKAVSLSEKRADFVSAVTHELRTPLTTFKMYTEMLSTGMVPDEKKKVRYLNILSVEADRLSHLIENVLCFARLERGRAGAECIKISIRELFERFESRLADRVRLAGMTLEIDLADWMDREVFTSPVSIEHILFNLVDNACKYASGVAPNKIWISGIDCGAGTLCLKIFDLGPGIREDIRKKLFQPFSKSAVAAAGTAPGIGLGLSLSRRLAENLGGSLVFDASCGQGACFILKIPAA